MINNANKIKSFIVIHRANKKVIGEVFVQTDALSVISNLDITKYAIVPIMDYLRSLNK